MPRYLLILFSVIGFGLSGCDSSVAPAVHSDAKKEKGYSITKFPLGVATSFDNGMYVGQSARKLCLVEVSTGATECSLYGSYSGDPEVERPRGWQGNWSVQHTGYPQVADFDIGGWPLGQYNDVFHLTTGEAYRMDICGAGNTFMFTFNVSAYPEAGYLGSVPGIVFGYSDDGDYAPLEYGDGLFQFVSTSSAADVSYSELVFNSPIDDGPACEDLDLIAP